MPEIPRSTRTWLTIACLIWAGSVGSGLFVLWQYSLAPGVRASAPDAWPAQSTVGFVPGRANLVLAAHPHCPCTRASLAELARIVARESDRIAVHVLFVRPAGQPERWVDGDLWEAAAAIPGVEVLNDDGGREASRFGAHTSGQVVLFDAAGRRRFQGGITAARGHEGDNYGKAAVIGVVERGRAERGETPVFGCALDARRECSEEGGACPS